MSVYSYQAVTTANQEVSLDLYQGKVLVIANTASKCGLTPQYGELQKLYDRYRDQGLVVLGFPCNQFGGQEPGRPIHLRSTTASCRSGQPMSYVNGYVLRLIRYSLRMKPSSVLTYWIGYMWNGWSWI